jgi:hypothetical protein
MDVGRFRFWRMTLDYGSFKSMIYTVVTQFEIDAPLWTDGCP